MTKSRWDLFKEAASDVVTAISGITPTTDAKENESKQLDSPPAVAAKKHKPTKLAPLNPESEQQLSVLKYEIADLIDQLRKRRNKISECILNLSPEELIDREHVILLRTHSREMLDLKFKQDEALNDTITEAKNTRNFLSKHGLLKEIDELLSSLQDLEKQRDIDTLEKDLSQKRQEVEKMFVRIGKEYPVASKLAGKLKDLFTKFNKTLTTEFNDGQKKCAKQLQDLRHEVEAKMWEYTAIKVDRLLDKFERAQLDEEKSHESPYVTLCNFKKDIDAYIQTLSRIREETHNSILELEKSCGATRETTILRSDLQEKTRDLDLIFAQKSRIDDAIKGKKEKAKPIKEEKAQRIILLLSKAIKDNIDFWNKQITITSSAKIDNIPVPKVIAELKKLLNEHKGEPSELIAKMQEIVHKRPGYKRDKAGNLMYDSYFEKLKYTFFGVRKANTSKFCEIILKLDEIDPAILKQNLEAMGLKISSPDSNKPRSGLEYKS